MLAFTQIHHEVLQARAVFSANRNTYVGNVSSLFGLSCEVKEQPNARHVRDRKKERHERV